MSGNDVLHHCQQSMTVIGHGKACASICTLGKVGKGGGVTAHDG